MEEMNEGMEQTQPLGIEDLIRHLADEGKDALLYVSTGAGMGWVGEKFLPLRYIIGPVASTLATAGGGALGLYTWTKRRGESLDGEDIGEAILLAGRDITVEGVKMVHKALYTGMRHINAFAYDPERYIDAHVMRPIENLRGKPVTDS